MSVNHTSTEEKSKERISTLISKYIDDNKLKGDEEFAGLVGVSRSTITSWRNKTQRPKDSYTYKKLANTLNTTPAYLRGESDNKISGNEDIGYILAIKDNAINGLKDLKNICENPVDSFEVKHIDTEYADIVSYMISNVDLWLTLINEASRLVALYTNETTQMDFNLCLNENDSVSAPTLIDYEDISKIAISKCITKIFNEYIEKKLKEQNLTKIDYEMEFFKKHKKR